MDNNPCIFEQGKGGRVREKGISNQIEPFFLFGLSLKIFLYWSFLGHIFKFLLSIVLVLLLTFLLLKKNLHLLGFHHYLVDHILQVVLAFPIQRGFQYYLMLIILFDLHCFYPDLPFI